MVFSMMHLNYQLIKFSLFYSKQNIHNIMHRVYSICQGYKGGCRTNKFPICSRCLTRIGKNYQGHELYFSNSQSKTLYIMYSFSKVKN